MKILVCDNYSSKSLKALEEKGYEVVTAKNIIPTGPEIKNVCGLLIRSRTKINDDLLKKAKNLKVIVSATAGFDHIDHKACIAKNIQVMHTPQANVQSAAELTLNFMLSSLRNFCYANSELQQNYKWRDSKLRGNTLCNKNVGIIGLGRIGSKVAQICKAFDAKVSYYDPYVENSNFEKFKTLEKLLINSEIVTLHVPLTNKTKYLINKHSLNKMKSTAILINCSRGLVINQTELIPFLENNPSFKAGLDVFNIEPCEDSKLLSLYPQFIGTPHIGAFTHEAMNTASLEAVEKLDQFFKSKSVSDTVPPNAAWAKDL